MKIGNTIDTHNNIENVRVAIDRFKKEEVELIIHAGDFLSSGIIDEFRISQNEAWHPKY
jgi:predicted phosphodiesterase